MLENIILPMELNNLYTQSGRRERAMDLLKQISLESPTPILTGEDIYLKEPFEVLCANHAVGKIQPDIATALVGFWRRTRSGI